MSTQSEYELEQELIKQLQELGYEYVPIANEQELLHNLKLQLEKHNAAALGDTALSDDEFQIVLRSIKKGTPYECSEMLRKDAIGINRNGKIINIKLLNTQPGQWCQNEYQVTNQVSIKGERKNRYDVTLLVNGFPLCQIELKRHGIELKEAYNQVDYYQKQSYLASSSLFQYVQLFVISNGINSKYFANGCPSYEFTSFWTDKDNEIIADLKSFAEAFLEPCHLSKMIINYMQLTSDQRMLVLRPYQYHAVEAIIDRIKNSNNNGYIWHTTGSGKTLTSFKASQIIQDMPEIDKVLFVVDRRDLDIQTTREFDSFQEGSVDSTESTKDLISKLCSTHQKVIITTLQKLNKAINSERHAKELEMLRNKKVVFLFDECHRSQFGDTHKRIRRFFNNHQMIGFTGTPIFVENSSNKKRGLTTKRIFNECLHKYVIVDAIGDGNVLRFSVDYVKTFAIKDNIEDELTYGIDRNEVWMADERIDDIVDYIINIHDIKTKKREFNAIFCTGSIAALIKYYDVFKQKKREGKHNLKIAPIFSVTPPNRAQKDDYTQDGKPPEGANDKLKQYMAEYNKAFDTNYQLDDFYKYSIDVSKRVKNQEVDILLVVSMFLTGFDSKQLNTLYVDKNLQHHGLIQAFSRTNRILDTSKSHGNIVCFRPHLKDKTDEAIELFSNKEANAIILMKTYEEYVGLFRDALLEMREITPDALDVVKLRSEEEKLKFVQSFRNLARILNILNTFTEFEFTEEEVQISEQEFMGYKSAYLDIRDAAQAKDKTSILQDVDFEIELFRSDIIDVDYILNLLAGMHQKPSQEQEETLNQITKTLDSDDKLRSKKDLILAFIEQYQPWLMDGGNDQGRLRSEFRSYMSGVQQKELEDIVKEFNLDRKQLNRALSEHQFKGYLNEQDLDSAFLDELPFMKRIEALEQLMAKIIEWFKRFSD